MKREWSTALRITVVITLLSLVLFGMIGRKQWTLSTGTPVLLETQPVDPRSLFRGDYVRLNYTINTLETRQFPVLASVKRGDAIYMSLKKAESYWQPVNVAIERPDTDAVVLRGHVDRVMGQRWNNQTRKYDDVSQVQVKYGIENYFVPEGEGRAIERPAGGERVSIEVAVDSCGNAGIRAVLVNGQPRYVETLF